MLQRIKKAAGNHHRFYRAARFVGGDAHRARAVAPAAPPVTMPTVDGGLRKPVADPNEYRFLRHVDLKDL